jgi:hypothetical protein
MNFAMIAWRRPVQAQWVLLTDRQSSDARHEQRKTPKDDPRQATDRKNQADR